MDIDDIHVGGIVVVVGGKCPWLLPPAEARVRSIRRSQTGEPRITVELLDGDRDILTGLRLVDLMPL